MATIDILTAKNKLTKNDEGKIALNPLSRFEFRTYPINYDEHTLYVDEDVYLGLLLKVYQFTEDLSDVEEFNSQTFMAFLQARSK